MPFRDQDDTLGFAGVAPAPKAELEPSLGSTWGAAFRQENDVVNAIELLARPKREPEAGFNLRSAIVDYDAENRTNLWDNYRDNFLGTRSKAEFLDRVGRINEEQRDRETLEASGWAGTIALLAAGITSPTVFLPFVGAGLRGGRFVASAAALGATGGALQELPLQANQELRTATEGALSIAGATIVGGLLGKAMTVLAPGEFGKLAKTLEDEIDMVVSQPNTAIPGSLSAGRTPVAEFAGKLQHSTMLKSLSWFSPVTDTINQDVLPAWSTAMAKLSTGGLRQEGNALGQVGALGGTVEANIKTYNANLAQALEGISENFNKYIFGDGNVPGLAPNLRAGLASFTDPEKLSRQEFNFEVSKALRNLDEHVIPEVAATAKLIRTKLLNPIFAEAQRVGLIGESKLKGDDSYLYRLYDHKVISANPQEFIETIARDYAERLEQEFGDRLRKLEAREAKDDMTVRDLVRPKEEVAAVRAQLETELKLLELSRSPSILKGEDLITNLRAAARALRKAGKEDEVKEINKQIRDVKEQLGPEYEKLEKERSSRRSRLQGLARAQVVLADRQMVKLNKIERLEELNQASLDKVARKGQTILNKVERYSDDELDADIKELNKDFAGLIETFDRTEARTQKLLETEQPDMQKLLAAESKQEARKAKLTQITEEIEALESVNRGELRTKIAEALDIVKGEQLGLIERRVERMNRLAEQASKLAPEQVDALVKELIAKGSRRRTEFVGGYTAKGIPVDMEKGTADFYPYAKDLATTIKDKIQATSVRVPLYDVLGQERGPELARMLETPSNKIEKFLENDIDKVLHSYIRSVAPDIEIVKKFGDVRAMKAREDALNEFNDKLANMEADIRAKNPKATDVQVQKQMEKQSAKLAADFKKYQENFDTILLRARNQWGLPERPDSMSFRIGETMMRLNVLRLMGGATLSSLPDLARPIMKYGLTRVWNSAFVPLVTDTKALKMSAREARLSGAALDTLLHIHSSGLYDILDQYGRNSKFERGLSYATQKMGLVTLLDQWTTMNKQIAAATAIGKLSDSFDIVVGGAKATKKEYDEAVSFLAYKGFSPELAEKTYAQLTSPTGGARINGTLMPNTENWTDKKVQQAFRAALVSEVDDTIIVPGLERPKFMDRNVGLRMLTQFKSFGMSATTKVLMAGMQQHDTAFFTGAAMSLALGALSYYTYAVSAGGDTYEKMMKASPGKWADEAIGRSGLLGIFSEGQRLAERIPFTKPYASFGGDVTTRRGGGDLIDVALGPSFGALKTAGTVLMGMDDPSKSTAHALRQLAPFQNHLILRRGFNAMEDALDLPERRN